MNDFAIAIVSWSEKQAELYSVRRAVFIKERTASTSWPRTQKAARSEQQEWTAKEKSEEWPSCTTTAGAASGEK